MNDCSPRTPCLDDDEVLAFSQGELSAERVERVHEHLDECESCQHLVNEAIHGNLDGGPTDPIQWHTTFARGECVDDRYQIRRFITRGGMGEVYEAYDPVLDERVALKTVTSTACDSATAVRRLKAEVQLSRKVSHPNVCRIHNLDTHTTPRGDTVHFLTMEFVDGETLGQAVRLGGAFPIPVAIAIARQLLGGLRAAHAAGVLHRDFKSDNVMLRPEPDGTSTAVILDFGLARARDGARYVSSSSHSLLGTLDYVAPEQLQGQPHSVQSDLYSFGIVLFEMLTGAVPFLQCGSAPANALERLKRAPTPPSRLNPSVGPALNAIALRCLERSARARYQSADEVLAALAALEQPPRSRRSGGRVARLGIAFAAVLTALGAYWIGRPPREPPLVESAPVAQVIQTQRPAVERVVVLEATESPDLQEKTEARVERSDANFTTALPPESLTKPQPRRAWARATARAPAGTTPAEETRRVSMEPPVAPLALAAPDVASAAAVLPAASAVSGRRPKWERPFATPIAQNGPSVSETPE